MDVNIFIRYFIGFFDSNWEIQFRSAVALSKLKDVRGISVLINNTAHHMARIRAQAEVSLIELRDFALQGGVESLLQSFDEKVRRMAARIIVQIATPKADRLLIERIEAHDLAVVAEAYDFFLRRLCAEWVPTLSHAMRRKGNLKMGEAFLNSGNEALRDSAINWAHNNGYKILP